MLVNNEGYANNKLFKSFFNDLMTALHIQEIYAMQNNVNDFQLIFRADKSSTRFKVSNADEILEYVIENLINYTETHKVNVRTIDKTKVTYWVGMYIYEKLNSTYGIKFLHAVIVREIYNDTGRLVNADMCNKINKLADQGQETFFKYYGRFGLYHSLKQIHKTLSDSKFVS